MDCDWARRRDVNIGVLCNKRTFNMRKGKLFCKTGDVDILSLHVHVCRGANIHAGNHVSPVTVVNSKNYYRTKLSRQKVGIGTTVRTVYRITNKCIWKMGGERQDQKLMERFPRPLPAFT